MFNSISVSLQLRDDLVFGLLGNLCHLPLHHMKTISRCKYLFSKLLTLSVIILLTPVRFARRDWLLPARRAKFFFLGHHFLIPSSPKPRNKSVRASATFLHASRSHISSQNMPH